MAIDEAQLKQFIEQSRAILQRLQVQTAANAAALAGILASLPDAAAVNVQAAQDLAVEFLENAPQPVRDQAQLLVQAIVDKAKASRSS